MNWWGCLWVAWSFLVIVVVMTSGSSGKRG